MDKNKLQFYANGKLLLSGEYFVLKGAESIALPVRFGQYLSVQNNDEKNLIRWTAFSPQGLWFSCCFSATDFTLVETSDSDKSNQLIQIFKELKQLQPDLFVNQSLQFETKLTFDSEWGLGTSSTLIANLANWAAVDPYVLNEKCFSGSGFDIACASASQAIKYQRTGMVEDLDLNYPFQDQLYFVYSGIKKATKAEVKRFTLDETISQVDIERIDLLADRFVNAESILEFQRLMEEHEQIVSAAVGIKPVKITHFPDFKGAIKSLGAWGGDFFLVATEEDDSRVKEYFNEKGNDVVFNWDELILNEHNYNND